MRQLQARGTVPGIAVSGFGMAEDLRKSRDAGFLAHLTKPLDFLELEATIRQLALGRAEGLGET